MTTRDNFQHIGPACHCQVFLRRLSSGIRRWVFDVGRWTFASSVRPPSSLVCRLFFAPGVSFFAKASVSAKAPPDKSAGRLASGVWRRLHGPSSAFTLIELLVVMVIAVVIMAVSLPSFISIGRGAGMRTAVNNVRSTAALSRQWAITHREQITFVASSTGLVYTTNNLIVLTTNDHACYYATNAEGNLVQSITDLPLDVTFESSSSNTFKTDGGLGDTITKFIVLVDKNNRTDTDKQRTISINGLTGGIKVQ